MVNSTAIIIDINTAVSSAISKATSTKDKHDNKDRVGQNAATENHAIAEVFILIINSFTMLSESAPRHKYPIIKILKPVRN